MLAQVLGGPLPGLGCFTTRVETFLSLQGLFTMSTFAKRKSKVSLSVMEEHLLSNIAGESRLSNNHVGHIQHPIPKENEEINVSL